MLRFDGAFGTYYRKLTGNTYCEAANLLDRETVLAIHKEYISAGACAVKTNTFNANGGQFDRETLGRIIEGGFYTASEAVLGTDAAVYCDIGWIDTAAVPDASEEYIYIAKIFIGCGGKNFLFETLDDVEPVLPAVKYIRENVPDGRIILSFAAFQDGYTSAGKYYGSLIKTAIAAGADIAGLNCVCGPSHMLELLKKLGGKYPVSAMPNSNYPIKVNGRLVYRDNPEYFSDKLLEIASLGVSAVGGCCGTTPEHMRLAYKKIKETPHVSAPDIPDTTAKEKPKQGELASLLTGGKFVITVELPTPSDTDAKYLTHAARQLVKAGADAITLADSPLARARGDSIMLSAMLQRETGIATVPHLTCRDRNSIAIKGSLIAASIEGVRNVLAVTGDGSQTEDRLERNVFNFNSVKLISYINSLNRDIFKGAPFLIGAALNINAVNFEAELRRAKDKLSAGADVFFTQSVFSDAAVNNLKTAREALNTKLIAGIMPIASYKNAVFLNNEVSGIEIPEAVIESLRDRSPEDMKKISLAFAHGIFEKIKDSCDGLYIVTPLRKTDFVIDFIGGIYDKNR